MTPPYQLLALGRFDRIKAFDVLLYACKILKDSGLSFHLTLVGDGPRKILFKRLTKKLGSWNWYPFRGSSPTIEYPRHSVQPMSL